MKIFALKIYALIRDGLMWIGLAVILLPLLVFVALGAAALDREDVQDARHNGEAP